MNLFKRLLKGFALSLIIVGIPLIGNMDIIYYPQIWIFLLFGTTASVLQPDYNPFKIIFHAGDKGTGAQIIWSVYITQVATVTESAFLRFPQSMIWDIATFIGLIGMIIGLGIRSAAVLKLRNLFTMHLAIHEEHYIISSGIYSLVRHPSYLGAFIMYISTILFFHSWFSLTFAFIILPCAFLRRIKYEEEMMKNEFGKDYLDYSANVKMIIPEIY